MTKISLPNVQTKLHLWWLHIEKITKMQNKLTSQAMFWVTFELTVERIKNEISMTRFSFTICSMTFLQSREGSLFLKETTKQKNNRDG